MFSLELRKKREREGSSLFKGKIAYESADSKGKGHVCRFDHTSRPSVGTYELRSWPSQR